MSSALQSCPACRKDVAKSASSCPHCGKKLKTGLFLKLVIGVAVLIGIGVVFSPSNEEKAKQAIDELSRLASSMPSALSPSGELYNTFKLGTDATDVQRENLENKIKGQLVQWSLPVYEVTKTGSGYRIQTSSKSSVFSDGLIGTFSNVTARSAEESAYIEGLKTGDTVVIKGYVTGTFIRNIDLRPAMVILPGTANAALPPASTAMPGQQAVAAPQSIAPDHPPRHAAVEPSLETEVIVVRKMERYQDGTADLTVDRVDYNQKGMNFILAGDAGAKTYEFVEANLDKPIKVSYTITNDCLFCIHKAEPAGVSTQAAVAIATPGTTQASQPGPAPSTHMSPHRPSFDCAKASGAVEQMICSDAELAQADVRLSEAFRRVLAVYEGKYGKDRTGATKTAQRAWLKTRNACADRVCVATAYKERNEAVQHELATVR